MRNVLLIIRREYLVRVRTKAFLIFTVLMPLLVGTVVVLPSQFMMRASGTRHIVIVAADSALANSVKNQLIALRAADENDPAQSDGRKINKPELQRQRRSAAERSPAPATHHGSSGWQPRRIRLD